MFQMNGPVSLCLIVVAATVSILCGGCGSGGSNSNGMSQAQAQAVTEQVSGAVAQALESAFSSGESAVRRVRPVRPSLPTVVRSIQLDQESGCTPNGSGENCNWPISYNGTCPQGGTIVVAGDIEATLNGAGSGSVSSQVTVTPGNCAVSSLVINGDPNIAVGLNINFTNSAPVFPITLTEAGGISYGPNPSGSCKLNVTNTITSETSCTITGTVCGQSVNGSC